MRLGSLHALLSGPAHFDGLHFASESTTSKTTCLLWPQLLLRDWFTSLECNESIRLMFSSVLLGSGRQPEVWVDKATTRARR